jgi:hypothetical protein
LLAPLTSTSRVKTLGSDLIIRRTPYFFDMAPRKQNAAPAKKKALAKKAPAKKKAKIFDFSRLPFEIQKEIFQYILVPESDEILRPEEAHEIWDRRCFSRDERMAAFDPDYKPIPEAQDVPRPPCIHEVLSTGTQLLYVSKTVNSVAVRVLYGCNRFHFSSASLFNKFTDTINPLGEYFRRTSV